MSEDPPVESGGSGERWAEPGSLSLARRSALDRLAAIFDMPGRSTAEKLDQFAKYVPLPAIGRFLARYEIFKLVQDVPGVFIEAGVLGGGGLFSFVHFSFLLEPHNSYRKIIGFDTFSGFPALSDVDRTGSSAHMRIGGYADRSYDELLRLSEVHEDLRFLRQRKQIELVAGDIVESVPKYVKAHPELVVSLLYLDADLLEPTRVCLETFLPRMPKGAVIVFDELGLEEYPGETVAAAQVAGLRNLRLRKLPFSKSSYAIIE